MIDLKLHALSVTQPVSTTFYPILLPICNLLVAYDIL